jgi:hypothetical protein
VPLDLPPSSWRRTMRRAFLIILAVGVVLLAGGFLSLGLFPPKPQAHEVQVVIPNDRLGAPH